ncbi:MAG: cobalamin-dependent protein [Desulfobacterales bacterium]|nr:cobalamin-dependent protein [Desulfobacterales bacterium]
MIPQELYDTYFQALLKGDRPTCTQIVKDLLEKGIEIKPLYRGLFERSLYQVGKLWEANRISVAREHLVTAITENLLNLVYPYLFSKEPTSRKVIISCAANEHHQIGGKMVADIFEMYGWDSYFLGANTPVDQMVNFIDEIQPDMVGLSLSIYFNLPSLEKGIQAINASFPHLDIIIGGQAFKWGEITTLNRYKNLRLLASLDDLELELGGSPS